MSTAAGDVTPDLIDWNHLSVSCIPDEPAPWSIYLRMNHPLKTRDRRTLEARLRDEVTLQWVQTIDISDPEVGTPATIVLKATDTAFLDTDPAWLRSTFEAHIRELWTSLASERATETERLDAWLEGFGARRIIPIEPI